MPNQARNRTSRRDVLQGAIAAASGALGAAGARAQTKASQQEAKYQPTPKNGLSCRLCALFRPPRACQIVAGDIAPQGWCKFFDLPD
jgi:anaerobic selenocysteine-containing dehydrogenase